MASLWLPVLYTTLAAVVLLHTACTVNGHALKQVAQAVLPGAPVPRYPDVGDGNSISDFGVTAGGDVYAISVPLHAYSGGYDLQDANATMYKMNPSTLAIESTATLPYEVNLPQTGGYGYHLVFAGESHAYICTQESSSPTTEPGIFTELSLPDMKPTRRAFMKPVQAGGSVPSCSSAMVSEADGAVYFQVPKSLFGKVTLQRLDLASFEFTGAFHLPCQGLERVVFDPSTPSLYASCSAYTSGEFLYYSLFHVDLTTGGVLRSFYLGNQTKGQLVPQTGMLWSTSSPTHLVWGCNGQFGDDYEPQAINVIEFDVTSFDVVKNVTLSGTSGQTLYSLALAGDNVAYFGTSKGLYNGNTWVGRVSIATGGPTPVQQLVYPFSPNTNGEGVSFLATTPALGGSVLAVTQTKTVILCE